MAKRPKPHPAVKRIRDLRKVFQEVHRHGERALLTGDYKTFGEAVDVERSLIREQADVIATANSPKKRRTGVEDIMMVTPTTRAPEST
jgi:hypothetical protein